MPAGPLPASFLPATERRLLHAVATAQASGRAPALIAGVARDGELRWSGSRGLVDGQPPTIDTQFRIGSISKTFAAVLVLRLRDEGRLDLDDRVDQHLPGLLPPQITVRQLLSHTSGLATETPSPWWERVSGDVRPTPQDLLWPEPLRHPIGSRWHYSNPGFAVLGTLVETLRAKPWFDVVTAELLEPLGMGRTSLMPQAPHARGWAVHPWADVALREPTPHTGLMAPAGQLWSTVTDLMIWAGLLAGRRPEVLATETTAQMREPASPSPDDVSGYGLGQMLLHTPAARLHGHVGTMPGFLATLWNDPHQSLSAVVFANVTAGPNVPGLAADLLATVAELEPQLPEEWQPQPVDDELLALTGLWYRGAQPLVLHAGRDGALRFSDPGSGGTEMALRRDGTRWVVTTAGYYQGELLTVVRAGGGDVTHLDLGSVVITRLPYQPADVVSGGREDDGWQLPT